MKLKVRYDLNITEDRTVIILVRLKLGKVKVKSVFVGPCHHDMARPQVADGGTASNMEGSYEYIE